MNEHALATMLADVVRREIRTCAVFDAPARPTLPPPHDLEAERGVLEAVLSGRVRCAELAPLGASDFYSPSFAAFYAACAALEGLEPAEAALPSDKSPSLRAIVDLLERQGILGPELLVELHAVRDGTPACMRPGKAAARVLVASARRELCAAMSRIDAALRVGIEPDAGDRARVLELLGEPLPWWP